MSQGSTVSLPPSSQPLEGETQASAPPSRGKIWTRGVNKDGDWYCTHQFPDRKQIYHYVNQNGTVYMSHRDGSATFVPTEGKYEQRREHDPNSGFPAPTMEEIIEEYKRIKDEHREYQARPLRYRNGACTTTVQSRRTRFDPAWLFPICDCCDRYSMYDDDYPRWDDYEDDYEEYYGYEDYNNREDDEDDYDDEDDDTDDDHRSPSPGEFKPTVKQEDDKTIVHTSDGAHPPEVGEANVHVKQEIKEETYDRVVGMVDVPVSTVPAAVPGSAATGSGTGKKASRGSGIGPDVQTEAKRILRSHRSKPY